MDCAKTSESQAMTWTLWMLLAVRFSSAATQRDLFNSTATTLFAKAITSGGRTEVVDKGVVKQKDEDNLLKRVTGTERQRGKGSERRGREGG
jgi:hypothetical protein